MLKKERNEFVGWTKKVMCSFRFIYVDTKKDARLANTSFLDVEVFKNHFYHIGLFSWYNFRTFL